MEHEIEYLNAKCKKFKKGDPDLDFYKDLVETVEYNKKNRFEELQEERVSPVQYTSDAKKYKKTVEKLRAEATKKLGPKHESTLRLNKRVELLDQEISEIEQGMQDQQQQQEQVAPVEIKNVQLEVSPVASG